MTFQLNGGINELNQIMAMNTYNSVILLDFHAQWCGPCKQIAPLLNELSKQSRMILVKIDVDNDGNKDIVDSFSIKSMPTLIWLTGKTVAHRMSGANAAQIRKITAELTSQ